MENLDKNELDKIAMQVILNAGDGRNILNEIIAELENGGDEESIQIKLNKANDYLVTAHRLQTEVIQATVMQENFCPTLLFIHAQDTLMTINSELNIVKYLVRLFKKSK